MFETSFALISTFFISSCCKMEKKRTVRNEEDMEKNTSTVKMLRSLRKMGKLSVVMMAAIINKENKEMKARNKA